MPEPRTLQMHLHPWRPVLAQLVCASVVRAPRIALVVLEGAGQMLVHPTFIPSYHGQCEAYAAGTSHAGHTAIRPYTHSRFTHHLKSTTTSTTATTTTGQRPTTTSDGGQLLVCAVPPPWVMAARVCYSIRDRLCKHANLHLFRDLPCRWMLVRVTVPLCHLAILPPYHKGGCRALRCWCRVFVSAWSAQSYPCVCG